MKNKNNVYIPVYSIEQAENYRKVLEGMGEEFGNECYNIFDNGLVIIEGTNKWMFSYMSGDWGTKITFEELIDLLKINSQDLI